ncbi:N-acetylmuramoyl-L-alanine amidase [Tardiphaga robiniae]|uniref:N-acetylmuramoyl-L-alanine amidase n=1 Tax=Tardiphaga robiniae TaxID=943830 RepID=UPI0015866052|nr:N-acetylmuramoyl-L-alanine amidase [Tardiphaga robiniae]NUU41368.1 N-acetylmuramoyl-L-alanine amidase [Tardiphaga robiniae]
MIAIQNGRGYRSGVPLPFKASPNIGGKLVPEYIVLHDTASGLNDSGPISWLTDPISKVSAHVVIGRDGKITQLVPFNVKAWHAGQSIWAGRPLLNGFSIGIEIVNPGKLQVVSPGVYKGVGTYDTNKDPSLVVKRAKTAAHGDGFWLAYTDAQVAAVHDLCEGLCKSYGIKEIVTHWLISPGRKVDTNPLFPLEQLRRDLSPLLRFTKPVTFAEIADDAPAPAEGDESAGGGDELAPVTPGTDYAAPIGTRDTDESAGGVPALWRLAKSRITQATAGMGLTSVVGLLSDWRSLAVICAFIVIACCGYIIYRRSLVQ